MFFSAIWAVCSITDDTSPPIQWLRGSVCWSAHHRQTDVWMGQTGPLAALQFATRKSVKPLTKGNVWQIWSSSRPGQFCRHRVWVRSGLTASKEPLVESAWWPSVQRQCVGIINNINTVSLSLQSRSSLWSLSHWPRPSLLSARRPPRLGWRHCTGRPAQAHFFPLYSPRERERELKSPWLELKTSRISRNLPANDCLLNSYLKWTTFVHLHYITLTS